MPAFALALLLGVQSTAPSAGDEQTPSPEGRAAAAVVADPTRDAPGPGARNVHAMAYDPVRRVVVLHGGFHAPERFTDTWEWDGRSWRRLQP